MFGKNLFVLHILITLVLITFLFCRIVEIIQLEIIVKHAHQAIQAMLHLSMDVGMKGM